MRGRNARGLPAAARSGLDIIKAWPWAVCPKPDGAFYLFVDVHQCYGDQVRNSTELCTYLLDKAHVALVPGAAFGDDNCIRLSYAVADDVLADALSTALFVMGPDKAAAYWQGSKDAFEMVLVTEDHRILCSEGIARFLHAPQTSTPWR